MPELLSLQKKIAVRTGILFNGERVTSDILYPNVLQNIGILLGAAGNLPDIIYEVAEQHLERYRFAARFIEGLCVFDVASGCGFGSEILKNAGASAVFGVDISYDATKKSREQYGAYGLFLNADAAHLPILQDKADVVTSFETIEHTLDYANVLTEICRVLKNEGVLIVSTPNRLLSSPGKGITDKPDNPYHTQEFSQDEFLPLLAKYFKEIELYGQHWRQIASQDVAPTNTLLTQRSKFARLKLQALQTLYLAKYHSRNLFHYRDNAIVSNQEEKPGNMHPEYFIAVCKKPKKTS